MVDPQKVRVCVCVGGWVCVCRSLPPPPPHRSPFTYAPDQYPHLR